MANESIKRTARARCVHLWQIADKLGMSDSAFSRKLRYELPTKERQSIIAIIDEIAGGDQDAPDKAD